MLYDDHNPPHFHAEYGDYKVVIEISDGIIEGKFPRRALNSVLEWYSLHKDELIENWKLASQHIPLNSILPLE